MCLQAVVSSPGCAFSSLLSIPFEYEFGSSFEEQLKPLFFPVVPAVTQLSWTPFIEPLLILVCLYTSACLCVHLWSIDG